MMGFFYGEEKNGDVVLTFEDLFKYFVVIDSVKAVE